MPFTFKLAKRLALSKAVDTTAARALSTLRQVSIHPSLAVPASLYIISIRDVPAERPIVSDGTLCRSTNALAQEIRS
jgi:hypothetical protein